MLIRRREVAPHQPVFAWVGERLLANRQTNGVAVRRKCPYPRCFNASPCPTHQRDRRPSSHRRGYGREWRTYRESYLRDHPLCAHCGKEGNCFPPVRWSASQFRRPVNDDKLTASFCNRHLRFRSVTVPSSQTGVRMVCGVRPKVKPSRSICS